MSVKLDLRACSATDADVSTFTTRHRAGQAGRRAGPRNWSVFGSEKGGKNWLPRMRRFLNGAVTTDHFERLLRGERNEGMAKDICRWDPACYREHAYRARAPTADKMRQDQTINALAAIALASCPSAPKRGQLVTPLCVQKNEFAWPVWTDPLRLADLEASLCCGWTWPTITARWWIDYSFYIVPGSLREPEV